MIFVEVLLYVLGTQIVPRRDADRVDQVATSRAEREAYGISVDGTVEEVPDAGPAADAVLAANVDRSEALLVEETPTTVSSDSPRALSTTRSREWGSPCSSRSRDFTMAAKTLAGDPSPWE